MSDLIKEFVSDAREAQSMLFEDGQMDNALLVKSCCDVIQQQLAANDELEANYKDLEVEHELTKKNFDDYCEDKAHEVKELEARVKLLSEALGEAAVEIGDWGGYASEYFQAKHNLKGCIDKYISLINQSQPTTRGTHIDKSTELNQSQ